MGKIYKAGRDRSHPLFLSASMRIYQTVGSMITNHLLIISPQSSGLSPDPNFLAFSFVEAGGLSPDPNFLAFSFVEAAGLSGTSAMIVGMGVYGGLMGAVGGFVSGAIMTGTIGGALTGAGWGALGGAVAGGVGGAFDSLYTNANVGDVAREGLRAIAHGLTRGAIANMQGNKFRAGFWSGLAASAFNPGTSMGNASLGRVGGFAARTTIAATVGGTASELGGGKFANGAVSGTFVHMFNHEAEAFQEKMKEMFGYTQDPNAAALESSLGQNAENWYRKDAPITETVLKVGAVAISGGLGYLRAAYIAGYDAVVQAYAFTAGVVVNGIIAYEVFLGFHEPNFKVVQKNLIQEQIER